LENYFQTVGIGRREAPRGSQNGPPYAISLSSPALPEATPHRTDRFSTEGAPRVPALDFAAALSRKGFRGQFPRFSTRNSTLKQPLSPTLRWTAQVGPVVDVRRSKTFWGTLP